MLKSFMVSYRLWQSPVTPIIRRSPYLAPTPTPCPKPHFQGHRRSLCSFPMVTYCPHLTWQLRNINRIDSCPFQRTLLFWFPLVAFSPHHSLFLLLFRLTCEYWRTCISQGSILGFFFFLLPVALFRQFHLSLAPKYLSPAQISPLCSKHNYLLDISTGMTHRHLTCNLPKPHSWFWSLPFPWPVPLCTQSSELLCIPPSPSFPHKPSFNPEESDFKIHL